MGDTSITSNPDYPLPPPAAGEPAKPVDEPAKGPLVAKRSSKLPLILLLLAVTHLVVLVVAGGVGFGIGCAVTDGGSRSEFSSVAILPFNGDWQPPGEADNWVERRREYLEVSLPDAITSQVASKTSGSVKVLATHEIRGRHHPQQQPVQSGREMGVRAVLSGRVSKDGRLSLQLISVGSSELLWSQTYPLVAVNNQPMRWGVTKAVEEEISQAVANRLMGRTKG